MLNRVVIMGRLTRDPELRKTASGISVTGFGIACDRDFQGQGQEKVTDFFDVTCWRHTAEFTAKWFKKGQLVALSGRVQARKWTDKEGRERTNVEIVADEAHFAERKDDSRGYEAPPHPADAGYGNSISAQAAQKPLAPAANSFKELDDDESDLPFL